MSVKLYLKTRLGKTGFQIKGSDLIQLITQDRLRPASGPVQLHTSVIYIEYRKYLCHTFSQKVC